MLLKPLLQRPMSVLKRAKSLNFYLNPFLSTDSFFQWRLSHSVPSKADENFDLQSTTTHLHSHVQSRLDYKKLQANLQKAIENVKNRFSDANPSLVIELYEKQATKKHQINQLRAKRNQIAKQLGTFLQRKDPILFEQLKEKGIQIKQEITIYEKELEEILVQLEMEALKIPNDTHPEVPIGQEEASKMIQEIGTKRIFTDFEPQEHYEIAIRLGLLDIPSGSKVSGSKFVYLCNEAALMELALVQWTLFKLRQRGFEILFPPDIAHYKMVEGCGFHPRNREACQIYSIANTDLCLTATSEITLAGMKSNEILKTSSLPLKLAGFSHCFRTEIGHGGRETRGIYRLHQFSKVEMFGFTKNQNQAENFFQEMIDIQIEMLNELGLYCQIFDMATGDLGGPAYRKFDILAWMPGRKKFGEISSMSNCTDYQARRLNIRHKENKIDHISFVHTLNGTACAVPRLLIAILETYQQKDGSVLIPQVLQPFMGGQDSIRPRTTTTG
jgi:seryl-tRNA synthetase